MNETTIWYAEDSQLKKYGISADGDIIRLKVMCRESTTELESGKRELKDIIEKGKKARLQGLSPPASKSNIDKSRKAGKKPHKTIYIGWKNYVNDRYALFKADKGGGS